MEKSEVKVIKNINIIRLNDCFVDNEYSILGSPYFDELLNNDGKASLGSTDTREAQKQAITNNILPDLVLLQSSLNKEFIPRFKGYENAVIEWDVTELPEMQIEMAEMVKWLNESPITPNEFRTVLKYETLSDDGMDVVWLPSY